MSATRTAVVTGASSGIGAATARALAGDGWTVVCAARRVDRIRELASEIDGVAAELDVTDPTSVRAFVDDVPQEVSLLVNNAGGAFGQEPVAEADLGQWERMYATNVIGATRVTQALLPRLIANTGQIVFVTSTAADGPYEGGAGYCGAKAAERMVAGAMRLELVDQPVRVHDVAPGMVRTEEFALTRYDGDAERAAKVYEGVAEPLVAEDVAETIRWIASLPRHVDIDRLTVRPRAQAAQHKVSRQG
ncbi:NADP-dependent 3-hydroxy acid dehydrogenase YdfG [Friedmanniella endophytica]|uniref:NADP-dependent 3-hydroxy acid dehydrogenase YdfG n=1 Tax=Microlunatus kandeliicorticis TaxID=1759536 RepID=A0A7W3ITI1_9ACTN|nr:SDR family NAD(P)-dependent oxidoreductase [Microlunatus kandeliicorticis]MBA8794978.1 NADP-dependent 3-hydroxy acid dehydrogenase YdfG [Microlunatus kandeliicorticis]